MPGFPETIVVGGLTGVPGQVRKVAVAARGQRGEMDSVIVMSSCAVRRKST